MHLPSTSLTHLNDGYGTGSWLDHVVCTESFLDVIRSVGIDPSILSSDHFPAVMNISIQGCEPSFNRPDAETVERRVVDWSSLAPSDIQAFECAAMDNLHGVVIPEELLHCSGYSSIEHHDAITVLTTNR